MIYEAVQVARAEIFARDIRIKEARSLNLSGSLVDKEKLVTRLAATRP